MMNVKKTVLVLLSALLCLTAVGCSKGEPTETKNNTEKEPVVETTAQTEADSETDGKPETASKETEVVPDKETEAPSKETEAPDETEAAETEKVRIYDYLNGKTVTEEEQVKRPIAIMLNNIKDCLPQNSITKGDIFYEFPVEGGITRIMMLVSDYQNLDIVGSVRSSRDYFVDMLHTHDALYIHAGGSPIAYDKLMDLNINKLDAVTMYIPDMFYRDQYRLQYMASEHTLMTTGQRIVDGIKFLNYETEHKDSFKPSFQFYDENTDNVFDGPVASHIHMNSTFLQTVDFVYNNETGEYLRYQYNGIPHVDGLTEEQLSVKNVVILFSDVALIPGDSKGRLSVVTVGGGEGYYFTNGVRMDINWSRADLTAPLKLTTVDGGDLILNSGKTFICVVDKSVKGGIAFNYSW